MALAPPRWPPPPPPPPQPHACPREASRQGLWCARHCSMTCAPAVARRQTCREGRRSADRAFVTRRTGRTARRRGPPPPAPRGGGPEPTSTDSGPPVVRRSRASIGGTGGQGLVPRQGRPVVMPSRAARVARVSGSSSRDGRQTLGAARGGFWVWVLWGYGVGGGTVGVGDAASGGFRVARAALHAVARHAPGARARHLAVVAKGGVGFLDDVEGHAVHVGRRLEPESLVAPQAVGEGDVARLVESRARDAGSAAAAVYRPRLADKSADARVAVYEGRPHRARVERRREAGWRVAVRVEMGDALLAQHASADGVHPEPPLARTPRHGRPARRHVVLPR
mmetsp:Transcript_12964/g.43097  ORF Transcript_12964/g.43097 Transcript_12964/m.43097 type:complete len:338 (+) Transcript_12964:471-1484(+)